jgi:putative alpha-1,2-mannosidase
MDELQREFGDIGLDKLEQLTIAHNQQLKKIEQELAKTQQVMLQSEQKRMQTVEQQRMAQEAQRLMQVHPDATEIVTSQEFVKWRDSLPPELRTAVVEGRTADEAIEALNAFKAQTGYRSKEQVQQDIERTSQQRERRLASGLGVDSRQRSAPVTSGGGDRGFDEDALYQKILKKHGAL